MKPEIHPKYNLTKVTCACGNVFETGSVRDNLKVEVCSECHPFYTGKQKFLDVGGRVDRFKKKYNL
ncbi:MAG TPA: 50S ribosomal protein L31 [Paenibacillaceae bacterium]|nr:50S ribosomal protein L31 [Paenibacillaceae bacterium]